MRVTRLNLLKYFVVVSSRYYFIIRYNVTSKREGVRGREKERENSEKGTESILLLTPLRRSRERRRELATGT